MKHEKPLGEKQYNRTWNMQCSDLIISSKGTEFCDFCIRQEKKSKFQALKSVSYCRKNEKIIMKKPASSTTCNATALRTYFQNKTYEPVSHEKSV